MSFEVLMKDMVETAKKLVLKEKNYGEWLTDASRIININSICTAIDKIDAVIAKVRETSNNQDTLDTWMRVRAKLQIEWENAKVELINNGSYSFE